MQTAACNRQQGRCWLRSSRVPCVRVQALVEADATVRVRGSCNKVFTYVSDFSRLPEWDKTVLKLRCTRGQGKPLDIRHQFQVEQQLGPGMKVNTLYEVVDITRDKKVVYTLGSDLHTGTAQLVFMPDPNDPSFTMVRYMTRMELTEWRKALTPMVSGILKQVPEKSMMHLGALLNSSKSPIKMDPVTSRGSSSSSSRGSGGWNFGNMLNGFMSEASRQDSRQAASSGRRFASAVAEPQVDVLGYYAMLGLDGARPRSVSEDDIKAAFRKAALNLHPDKLMLADALSREQAEVAFKKVQRAYEVLRDPDQRRLYDQGKLAQLEEDMASI